MKLILHDLKNENIYDLFSGCHEDVYFFSALPRVHPCTGCFGCWLTTPGMCVIDDRARDFIEHLIKADELNIVSRLLYGGFSTVIKTVLDRSLSYILPYFDIWKDEMHHPKRYDRDLSIHFHIYENGKIETAVSETETMKGIASAVAKNFSATNHSCIFYGSQTDLLEALNENIFN